MLADGPIYGGSEILNLHRKPFVRVKAVMKNDGTFKRKPEFFVVDPQTVNFSNLRIRLARLFQIEKEFIISFKRGKQFISLTSDWDLDGAIHEASNPYLSLAVEVQPLDKSYADWDIIGPADIPIMESEVSRRSEDRRSFGSSIISQIGETMHKFQRALSFDFNTDGRKNPVLDQERYYGLFDREGRVISHRDLHLAIFDGGGMDPSLRPVVWKHLLNVYPHGLTLQEREDYLNRKCEEYYHLRNRWQHLIQAGTVPKVLRQVTNMIKKDVVRTDRTEKFYSEDDSENLRSLYNILTTYAVNHPDSSYCQGMGDMLSPILYVLKKESEAYICFCGLMTRFRINFVKDSKSITLKFRHLQRMLRIYDPELYRHLKREGALDLLCCYRWLLLELKREFPYNDTITMMEVLWASIPPKAPEVELKLFDVRFPTPEICDSLKDKTTVKDYLSIDEDHFGDYNDPMTFSNSITDSETLKKIKKWTFRVRRESMARDISFEEDEIKLPIHYRKRKYRSYIAGKLGRMDRPERTAELSIRSCKMTRKKNSLEPEICQSWSCGEVFEEKPRVRDALYDAREFLRNQWCYSNTVNEIQLNNWLNCRQDEVKESKRKAVDGESNAQNDDSGDNRHRHGSSDSNYSAMSGNYSENDEVNSGNVSPMGSGTSQSEGYESDLDSKETSTRTRTDDEEDTYESEDFGDLSDEDEDLLDSMAGNEFSDVMQYFKRKKEMLPPPHVLGDGNPFLLFLCISMLKLHRTEILKKRLEFNELSQHLDKFLRKHKFSMVYPSAHKMFTEYLNMGWDDEDQGDITEDEDS